MTMQTNKLGIFKSLTAVLVIANASLAWAEDEEYLKPLQVAQDVNNVDLLSGKYSPHLPSLSIPAAPNLSFYTLQQFDSKIMGSEYNSVSISGEGGFSDRKETYSLTYGGSTSEFFTCELYDCVPSDNTGSTLLAHFDQGTFTYKQGSSGLLVRYTLESSLFDYSADPTSSISTKGTWYASKIDFPDGETLTIAYDTETLGQVTYYRPNTVTTNLGYEMHFEYQSEDMETEIGASGWGKLATAYIVASAAPTTVLAQQSYESGTPSTVSNMDGRSWQYTGFSNALGAQETAKDFSLTLPGDTSSILSISSATLDYAGQTHNNFVTAVTSQGKSYTYAYTAKSGTGYDPRKQFSNLIINGPAGYKRTLTYKVNPAPSHRQWIETDEDSLGNTTSYTYTVGNRIETVTYPEGNKATYSYDGYGNVTAKQMTAKATSPLTDVITTVHYNNTANCIKFDCFRPDYVIDGKGNRTDYSFDPDHGAMLTKLAPAGDSGVRILTTNVYTTSTDGLVRLQSTTVCPQNDCADETAQVTLYTYWGNSNLPLTVTQTNALASTSLITTYTYDDAGRVIVEDGPLPGNDDAQYYRYDDSGRKTWQIAAKNQQGKRVASQTSYRKQDEQPLTVDSGTLSSAAATSLTVDTNTDYEYDSTGLKILQSVGSGDTVTAVTQYSYTAANMLQCETVRMNPLAFDSLPASACTLGTEGEQGPDRITRHSYSSKGQLLKTQKAYATPIAIDYVTMTYTDNGQVKSRMDANTNKTLYSYDGFDRLQKTTYPDNSEESFTYDVNNNQLSWSKRDSTLLQYAYDNTNLKTSTTIPNESAITTAYDTMGRQKTITQGTNTTAYVYDELGRVKSTTTNGRTLSYQYDAASRRARLTHPDNVYFTYDYDATGALTDIKESGASVLVHYGYDIMGRLSTITRGSSTTSVLDYDAIGRLAEYSHSGVNSTLFAYNPASQIIQQSNTDERFGIQLPGIAALSYVVNDLNQYTDISGQALSYDLNGNMTAFDGWTYDFNAQNRLKSADKGDQSLAMTYDATGRLASTKVNDTTTEYLYDGDELVAEYRNSTMINRYLHGVLSDDPLLKYTGATLSNKSYLLANHQGSIILEVDGSGNEQLVHQYGPYGEPMDQSDSRFRYTGQILLPGTELYYYKARVYHPQLGRFLQTDPVGYEDQMNLYAYVGNDPVNMTDPTGEFGHIVAGGFIGAIGGAASAILNGGTGKQILASTIAGAGIGAAAAATGGASLMAMAGTGAASAALSDGAAQTIVNFDSSNIDTSDLSSGLSSAGNELVDAVSDVNVKDVAVSAVLGGFGGTVGKGAQALQFSDNAAAAIAETTNVLTSGKKDELAN